MATSAAGALDPLDQLDASLRDFEAASPPRDQDRDLERDHFGYPSHHFGFRESVRTEDTDRDSLRDSISAGGFSPPAWRRLGNGDRSSGFWRKSDNLLAASGGGGYQQQHHHHHHLRPTHAALDRARGAFSRESSLGLEEESGDDEVADSAVLERAMRTRLPTGSISPEKEKSPEPDWTENDATVKVEEQEENGFPKHIKQHPGMLQHQPQLREGGGGAPDNYIRFAVRAEVQQRTEPIEAAVRFVRSKTRLMTKSWAHMVCTLLVAVFSIAAMRLLFEPAAPRPVPDLVKVASIARSFEPLIYYSENGVTQVGDLQATGVAVWDLGESVRSSNMTSAPIIVKKLDELSESLNTLAVELTKFFANVDGDIDGILIVMDWARRELAQVQHLPSAPLTSAFDNIHNLLSTAGILENVATGTPTRVGNIATSLFGMSNPQRTRETLQRTFTEFLAVLEDAISSELQHSLRLFALFEAIDHQFLNLARAVARESSQQDEQHGELLSSLWTRILGPDAGQVQKYERNRQLLQNVREKTVRNKGVLVEHNHKLLALKANLENLRRKLVSPLVRSVNSSTLTVEAQIRGLEDVGIYLEGVRTRQKGKLMEMLYGSGSPKEYHGRAGGGGGGGGTASRVGA